jgi:alpha-tubulin suppressor-like RCC1 family protein
MNELNRGRPPVFLAAACAVLLLSLGACGGGGGDAPANAGSPNADPATPSAPEATPNGPGATMTATATSKTGKASWQVATATRFSLRQDGGAAVEGPLRCTSLAPQALEVAADCSSVRGLRLGQHAVRVTGGGTSGDAPVKVIPPAQPVAAQDSILTQGVLAVQTDGRLLAWGDYSNWPLHDFEPLLLPTRMGTARAGGVLNNVVAASHGQEVTLALTEEGEVFSWGRGLTQGRPETPPTYSWDYGDLHAARVTADMAGTVPLSGIVAVSTDRMGALALTQDGTVYAWGPYSTAISPPASVRVPQLVPLPDKAIGISSAGPWAAIVLANGRLMTLRKGPGQDGSFNFHGRPATPGVTGFNVGDVIDASGRPLEGIVQASVSNGHGLALTRDGQVYAWGTNVYGELGQGTVYPSFLERAARVLAPQGTGFLGDVVMVAAGSRHSLALDNGGRVYSWGNGDVGQLGDGPGLPRWTSPTPRAYRPEFVMDATGAGPLANVRSVYAGASSSMALVADGRLFIWGLDELGPAYAAQSWPFPVPNEANTGALSFAPLAHWPDLWQRGVPAAQPSP